MKNPNWSREELIVAFNLYCKIEFTKINANYRPIVELSKIIGRSNNSLAMKLANFARFDPALKARGVKGLRSGSKGEELVWDEFNSNWEELSYQSEKLLADYKGIDIEQEIEIDTFELSLEGKEREALVKIRVNQNFFRKTILASYNSSCCITGISMPSLLVASHIIPWAANKNHRMKPENGLCLNALHDRAFDSGLITITPDYEVKLSDSLIKTIKKPEQDVFFIPYQNKKIIAPNKFLPAKELLDYHNTIVFKK